MWVLWTVALFFVIDKSLSFAEKAGNLMAKMKARNRIPFVNKEWMVDTLTGKHVKLLKVTFDDNEVKDLKVLNKEEGRHSLDETDILSYRKATKQETRLFDLDLK